MPDIDNVGIDTNIITLSQATAEIWPIMLKIVENMEKMGKMAAILYFKMAAIDTKFFVYTIELPDINNVGIDTKIMTLCQATAEIWPIMLKKFENTEKIG